MSKKATSSTPLITKEPRIWKWYQSPTDHVTGSEFHKSSHKFVVIATCKKEAIKMSKKVMSDFIELFPLTDSDLFVQLGRLLICLENPVEDKKFHLKYHHSRVIE